MAFAAGGIAIVALVVALYFGTDLLRPTATETPSMEPVPTAKPVEPAQDKPAEIAKSDGVPAESDTNAPLWSMLPQEPSAPVDTPKTKSEVTARSTPQTEQNAAARKQPPTPGEAARAKTRANRLPAAPATTSSDPFNPGTYQTLRPTTVFEQPSGSSRVVANIGGGVNINVVGSKGDWLEVHSRIGNPPGFIRRDDAKPAE
jgi:hypothetical protein